MHSIDSKNKQKVIFLTPFKGDVSILNKCIKSLLKEMHEIDKWIIVLDNSKLKKYKNIIYDKKITILNYKGQPGAGNARNHGLDYIIKKNLNDFILWPIDGDDKLIKGSRSFVTKKFDKLKYSMMSFGMVQIYKTFQKIINYSGEKKYRDLLLRYSTPCGSTIVRIEKNDILRSLRFGKRKRANDQLFFLKSANHFKKCYFHKKNILLVSRTNKNTLSSRKWRQPFYKFLVFIDLGLNTYEICYYFIKYLTYNLSQVFFNKKS